MNLQQSLQSFLFFTLAGLFEIGGGWLIWLWIKGGRTWFFGLAGMLLLIGFGLIMTLVPANFGRAYAAYGGIFVIMSLLWGWGIDTHPPDLYDIAGTMMILLGVGMMLYWPRH